MKLQAKCQVCGAKNNWVPSQANIKGKLLWSAGYACDSCGNQMEIDDIGFMPIELRKMIFDRDGKFSIKAAERIDDISSVKIKQILRREFSLDLIKTKSICVNNHSGFLSGTYTEMSWLRSILDSLHLSLAIERTDDAGDEILDLISLVK
ncbi:hypothetical protein [Deinococcus multiflagellatus]|uniref:Uncharacterized protein n=1 Tax=Deinococcus multiflagellatus TaxID=1656887 RepID=A0ABW1ZU52_9DEIO|nr:hypothetical protein [Deinococcus multiflagellatus]MBZ9715040.1 hypothetical protein [Deinococcus multiflagellatus]